MGRGGPFNTNFHVTKTGFSKNRVSGWQGFEAPGPAYWCQYGYAICKVDVRGIAHSDGDMVFMGRQEGMDVYETIVNRGLVQKYRLSNPIALGRLAEFLMDNTGNTTSANNISDPKHFRESMGHSCRSTTLSTQHQNNSNAIQRARVSKGLTQKTSRASAAARMIPSGPGKAGHGRHPLKPLVSCLNAWRPPGSPACTCGSRPLRHQDS